MHYKVSSFDSIIVPLLTDDTISGTPIHVMMFERVADHFGSELLIRMASSSRCVDSVVLITAQSPSFSVV
jgi:hypothetical protein